MNKKLVSSLFVLSSISFAQETFKIEEITTATRTKQKLIDVPVRIDKVNKDEIGLDNPFHPKETLNSTPGVLITQVAAALGHATAIRLPINYSPYYLYLQDGIPVQSTGFFNHNALWWTTYATSFKSVEILKGIGTAIYGSDAIGAVINIKSENPSWKLKRDFYIEGGSYGFLRTKLGISNSLNDNTAYLLKGSYMQSDGWRDKTDYKRGEILTKLETFLDESSVLKTSFIFNKLDAHMAGYLDKTTFETDPEDSGLPPDLDNPYRKVTMARLSFNYEKQLGKNLLNIIPYVRFNQNKYVATWIPKAYPERDSKTYTAGILNKYQFKNFLGKTFIGLDFEYTKADNHYFQTRPTTTIYGKLYPQGDIYKYNVDFVNVAPYIHHEKWIKKLKISLGLRYDYAKYDYDNKLTAGAFGVWYRPDDRTDEFSHISPKAGLVYLINSNNSVYARYANGFRIPQAGTLYELKTKNKEYKLDPEIADQYEIGYRSFYKKFTFDVSYYYMTIKDQIVTNRDANTGLTYRTNAGKTEHKGVEIGITLKPIKDIKIRGSYSYSIHKYLDYKTSGKVYDGKYMAMAPKNLGNLRLIYSPRYLKGFSSEVELQYVGSYYMDDLNTKKYSGYKIYNLKAEYKIKKKYRIFGKILNLTDKKYAETANISYGKERYRPGMPRTFYAGFEMVW